MRDDVSLSGRQIVASSFTRRWWFVFWVIISFPPYLFALISFPYFIPTVQRTSTCIWSIARIDYARDPFSSLFFLFCIQYSKSILFFFSFFFKFDYPQVDLYFWLIFHLIFLFLSSRTSVDCRHFGTLRENRQHHQPHVYHPRIGFHSATCPLLVSQFQAK